MSWLKVNVMGVAPVVWVAMGDWASAWSPSASEIAGKCPYGRHHWNGANSVALVEPQSRTSASRLGRRGVDIRTPAETPAFANHPGRPVRLQDPPRWRRHDDFQRRAVTVPFVLVRFERADPWQQDRDACEILEQSRTRISELQVALENWFLPRVRVERRLKPL